MAQTDENQSFLRKAAHALAAHRSMAGQFCTPALRRPDTPKARRGRLPVFFHSQVAWDTVWQRPQEIAMGLAKYRPVIFFSPVQLHEWTSRLSGRWEFHRSLLGGRLQVVTPLIFSGEYRHELVRKTNRHIQQLVAHQFTRDRPFIYLTNTPFVPDLLDNPARIAYDLIDDFCAFSWAPADGRNLERDLLAQADLVTAGTGYLREKFSKARPEIEFLPSGVQFERMTAPQQEPAELAALPHPRLLYVGTLNDRLNGELFKVAAEAAGTGSVIVIGPRHATFQAPNLPSNVHFLGLKPHESLPAYYQHCDLGLMPFADSPAAKAINPVKTLEYLACGLPVLSTPIPDVIRYYPEVVRVAEPGDWKRELLRLMAEESTAEWRERRVEFARNRTWNHLVKAMEKRLRAIEGKDCACTSCS